MRTVPYQGQRNRRVWFARSQPAMARSARRRGAAALGIAALCCALLGAPAAALAQTVADFWMTSLTGERFDSRTHKGPIVVSFFFVGCVPCIKEIPELHALVTKELPGAALLFVDPVGADSQQTVQTFADKLNVPAARFYRDPLGRFAKRFFKGEFVFPTIVGMRDSQEAFRLKGLDASAQGKILAALRP